MPVLIEYRILSAAGILAMGVLVSRQGLDPEHWIILESFFFWVQHFWEHRFTTLGGATLLYLWRKTSP